MAECVGSDRAYFVSSRAAAAPHVWCKPGISSPPGWPQNVPALVALFEPSADGIIHVPRVDRLPIGAKKETCVALGLGGWGCATNVNKDGSTVILGFDAIGRACSITAAGELSLLRMALDTIVYALERHSMERERARLEMRLQQARRMETVGTFSSGIAHNFNNILAGILGHTEMAEEYLASEARPRRNLAAIRRGAERARDLVDQILTFGRRREGRREHVCIKTLIAEAKSLLAPSLPAHVEIKVSEIGGNSGRFGRTRAAATSHPEHLQQCGPGDGQTRCHPGRDRDTRDQRGSAGYSGRNQFWPLRRGFDFRSGPRHERGDTGADFRTVLYDAS